MQKRLNKYLNNQKNTKPNISKQEVHDNSDMKIDQDFPGFPHGQANENVINPSTTSEKKVAAVDKKDGEKMNKEQINKAAIKSSGETDDLTKKPGE